MDRQRPLAGRIHETDRAVGYQEDRAHLQYSGARHDRLGAFKNYIQFYNDRYEIVYSFLRRVLYMYRIEEMDPAGYTDWRRGKGRIVA